MRARLHVRDGRIGFYREGTHELCDAGATGQLLPATIAWMAAAERVLARREVRLKPDTTHETHETHGGGGIAAIELAENIAGDERACHLELHAGVEPSSFASLGEGLTGLSAQRADRRAGERLAGTPAITDVIRVAEGDGAPTLRLRRDVRAFFQSNRFLLERLVQHVAALVPSGPVVDLYAGVGLFGLSLATAGAEAVTLVEGDPVSSADLRTNAEPFAGRVRVTRQSVEAYVAQEHGRGTADETFIVDPPRTGMSKDALAGTIAAAPRRIVYVSCDVATLARDTRTLLDAGYALEQITGIDLFPNTAHVESVALFTR
jgi:23S rRNA (uracil1939-C5)-methyltransferase